MRVEYRDRFSELEPLLSHVEKPSRYIDHEWGALSSPDAQHRVCLIYPDVYEVGLPNQGIAILYNVLNQQEGESCERSYVPWVDMADAMRAAGVPLLSLEGAAPVASFDIVGLHVPHEMAATNYLEALDLAGMPLHAEERGDGDPEASHDRVAVEFEHLFDPFGRKARLEAAEGVLGGVNVEVRQPRHYQLSGIVLQGNSLIALGEAVKDSGRPPVLADQVSVRHDGQVIFIFAVANISFYHSCCISVQM